MASNLKGLSMNEESPTRPFGRCCLRCDLFRPINGHFNGMICQCEHPDPDYRQPNHWIDEGVSLPHVTVFSIKTE
jgi:hypothetical protein